MPVNAAAAVARDGVWHWAHPTRSNSRSPFSVEADGGAGDGGAERRMKSAKLTMSEDILDAVPAPPPLSGLSRLVESSGVALNTQSATADRSFGKFSFETPCSTL